MLGAIILTNNEASVIHKGGAESFRLTVRVVCSCIGGILNDKLAVLEGTDWVRAFGDK
jgi:hypothetical protein